MLGLAAASQPTTPPAGLFVGLAVLWLVFFVIGIGALVFTIVCVVDMARRPDWQWRLSGQEKVLWIVLVVVVNFFAIPCFIYWFSIRHKLIAVEGSVTAGHYGPLVMTAAGWAPGMPVVAAGPPPGWFPDPSGGGLRYWDGFQWTDHTHPGRG